MRNLTKGNEQRGVRHTRGVIRLHPKTSVLTSNLPILEPLHLQRGEARPRRATARDRWCRFLNIVVALIGLILTAPIILMIAALIKLTSPGPVFFTQQRVGLDRRQNRVGNTNHRRMVDHGGKLFKIYKFRTMRVTQEAPQVWAVQDDPRVTPIGRVLRKYRLDELPQLINVLKGDMNIVGPRPEQPLIFAELRTQINNYPHRQKVLPGITGWAQINQAYDTSLEDVKNKVRLDLEYIERRSWWEDLKIMVKTLPVMIFRKGGW